MEMTTTRPAAAAKDDAAVVTRRIHCWYGGGGGSDPVAFSINNALSAIVSFFHHGRHIRSPKDKTEEDAPPRGPCATAAALYGAKTEGGPATTTTKRRLMATYQIESGSDSESSDSDIGAPFPRELPAVAWYGKWGDGWKILVVEELTGRSSSDNSGSSTLPPSSPLLVVATAEEADQGEEQQQQQQRKMPDGWIRVLAGLTLALIPSPSPFPSPSPSPSPPLSPPPPFDLAGMTGAAGKPPLSSSSSSSLLPPKYFYPIEVGDAVGAAVEDEDTLPGRAVGDREKIVCGIKALAALAGEKSQVTLRGSARELRVVIVASSSLPLQQHPHPLPSLTLTLPLIAAPARPLPPIPLPSSQKDSEGGCGGKEEEERPSSRKKTKIKKTPVPLLCQTAVATGKEVSSPPLATADDGDSYACRARYYLDAKKGRHRRQGQRQGQGGAAAAILPFPTQQLVAIYHPKESVRSAAAIAAEDRGCTPLTLSTYAETRRLILSGGTRGLVAILADADSLPRLRRSVEKAGLASLVRVAAIPALVATGDAPGAAAGLLPPLLPSFECAVSDALGFERRRIRRILVAIRQDAGILGEMLDRALALPSSSLSSSSSSSLPPPVVAVITRQPRDTEIATTMVTLSSEYDLIFADECPDDPATGERQGREKGMEFARRIRLLAPSPRDAPVLVAIVDRQRPHPPPPSSSSSSFSSSSSSSSSSDEGDVDGGPLTAVFDYVLHRPFSLDRVRNVVSSAERALLRRNSPAPPR